MEYPALFEPQPEGGYLIAFPDFDWGVSQGDADPRRRTKASRLRSRKYRLIRLPAMQAAKAELYRQFRPSGLRRIDPASRMGIPKTVVDRLFDLDRHIKLKLPSKRWASVLA
jgi:hypothetical protein